MAQTLYYYLASGTSGTVTVSNGPNSLTNYTVDPVTGNIANLTAGSTYYYTGNADANGASYAVGSPSGGPRFISTSSTLNGTSQTVVATPVSSLPPPLNCYVRGTRIATEHGETPIEDLRPGDLIRTASGALRPILWIGSSEVRQSWPDSLHVSRVPMRIRAGALGLDAEGGPLPRRDLLTTHRHAFGMDGYLFLADGLCNGTSIYPAYGTTQWDYFHIKLETHDLVLAEGVPSESYREVGNRALFDNAASAPGVEDGSEEQPCLPLIQWGPSLDHAKARIDACAATLPVEEADNGLADAA